MISALNEAGLFLTQVVFDLYIFIVMLRILLQWVNVDFHSPIFQAIARLTDPPLQPLRRLIPVYHGIDIAAIVFLSLLQLAKLILLAWLQAVAVPHIVGLLVWSFADLFGQLMNIFFYAILILIILSWLNPLAHGSLLLILHRLTEPLLSLARRYVPSISGLDLSPVVILIGIKLIEILLVKPLLQVGMTLTLKGF